MPPPEFARLPLTVQLVSVIVQLYSSMPPADWTAELPEMVESVSVASPLAARPAALPPAELPEMVVLTTIKVALPWAADAAAGVTHVVAGDGALGQRERSAVFKAAALGTG